MQSPNHWDRERVKGREGAGEGGGEREREREGREMVREGERDWGERRERGGEREGGRERQEKETNAVGSSNEVCSMPLS